ncbi:AraC family transcriptional regulator [Nocardiopsis halophila]|uniref:AraC family transcriptional regulator n=1 Tax=Nocardiopsis halophila TaxID=141692 RepID=UPI00036C7930|nr:AraC family transcriptional regulator [Nocardiopsis halophila]
MAGEASSADVPAAAVRAVLWGARRQGVACGPLLLRAGIPPSAADGRAGAHSAHGAHGAHVPADRFARLVREACAVLGDELLGLAPGRVPPGGFAMMCRAALHSRDAGAALRRAAAFYALFPGGPRPRLGPGPRPGTVRWAFTGRPRDAPPPVRGFAEACLLGVTVRTLEWAVDRPVRPLAAEVSPGADVRRLPARAVPGGRPVPGAGPALVLDERDLAVPLVRSEAELEHLLSGVPAGLLRAPRGPVAVAERVARLLARSPEGPPSAERTAAVLGMSPPTLRRRLRTEGTSFRRIRERVLCEAAMAMLAEEGASVARTAERLGFAEPSAFQRAFKRWADTTPGAYRDALRGGADLQRAGAAIESGGFSARDRRRR